MTILAANNIDAGYGAAQILHGVSVTVESDEIVTIIGPNGCGKSTLMKTIIGLIGAMAGRVVFDGQDVTDLRADMRIRAGIGYVPQLQNVFPSLTVFENLEIGGFHLDASTAAARIEALSERFPILRLRANQAAGSLSGGERQLVAMSAAMMCEPKLMLLDEPSAGLSPIATERMFEKIQEIRDAGTATLIVEQNAYQSLGISDRAYVLSAGRNEIEGPASEILDNKKIRDAYLGGN